MGSMVRKLSDEQKKCNICGGGLRELNPEEQKKIRVRFGLPRGIYICKECNNVATIGLTTIDVKSEEWSEIVENLNQEEFMSERDAIDKILETVSVLPEQHVAVVSIGRLFKCEGLGVKCSLYKIASSGIGPKEFCSDGWCKYDPYPPEYKKLFWFETESSWPKNCTGIASYWLSTIENKANNAETRINAINRVGTIATKSVSEQLCTLFFDEEIVGVKEAILTALNKHKATPETEQVLLHGLASDSPESIQLLLLKQLRMKYYHYDTVDLTKKISYLMASSNNNIKEEAKKTLSWLKKQASKEKPDIKKNAFSAKD